VVTVTNAEGSEKATSGPSAAVAPKAPVKGKAPILSGVAQDGQLLSVGNGIGGGVAPWFGGYVHDLTGSYRIAFLIAVGFCAVGAACFWLARPPRDAL